MAENKPQAQNVLGDMAPAKSIAKLAIPATIALLAKAVYNIVDTAYIGMLNSDIRGDSGWRDCAAAAYNGVD